MAKSQKRILLTGGGTGGHVCPLLAVADSIIKLTKLGDVEMFYAGPKNPLNAEFSDKGIKVYNIASSKLRRYFDLKNFLDVPKFFFSLFQAFFILYRLMPDVVFSKGGPGAFPVTLAARFYFIPVIIHESDAIPGLTTRLSAVFAKRIGISFKKASEFFPPKKTALVGNPVRSEILNGVGIDSRQAKTYLGFNPDEPLVLVLGGSQGAAQLNTFILNNLEELLGEVQIYHQTGPNNEKEVEAVAKNILNALSETKRSRYKLIGFLGLSDLKQALSAADVVFSRAGAGGIFEIAAFGKPSILVPLGGSANDHQLYNAYDYAENGAAIVVEEGNFKINIILTQIREILRDARKRQEMSSAAKSFSKPNAAEVIAQEILKLAGI